ncbi:hypothetical protein U8527_14270 [Kordia algicida OT-1]|uniref:Uncharacterized protein n=1 Tax=Kordia algicida OT-1 TaxID=391587 RepID=A9DY09_9FLAO|nr:hypothetical protein [Kordia algicida]EDP96071.1 hypothetical protein KAOT1_07878 [Kordia algicida OT-1]
MGKRKISLNNPWFVTLISTMVGIIAGLYITSFFESNRLYNAKENALKQVESELKDNYKLLKEFNERLSEKYEPVGYILSNLNEEMNLIIHKDSLESFKKNTEKVFTYDSFTAVDETKIKLHGDFDFNIEAGLMGRNLSDIVWNSYKQTNYLSITDFECLTAIETYYQLQKEVNGKTEVWKNDFFQADFTSNLEETNKFMNNWRVLLMKQKLLLDYYKFIDNILANCE